MYFLSFGGKIVLAAKNSLFMKRKREHNKPERSHSAHFYCVRSIPRDPEHCSCTANGRFPDSGVIARRSLPDFISDIIAERSSHTVTRSHRILTCFPFTLEQYLHVKPLHISRHRLTIQFLRAVRPILSIPPRRQFSSVGDNFCRTALLYGKINRKICQILRH